MKMFDRLLSRFGYIKLDSYGLQIGRDGRVRTTHRDLHDDGSGSPIVGWFDDDVEITNLPAWRSLPALAAPEEDEWDMVITRARVRIAALSSPDPDDEAPTMHDISLPPPAPPPRPPRPPIPHVPRPSAK